MLSEACKNFHSRFKSNKHIGPSRTDGKEQERSCYQEVTRLYELSTLSCAEQQVAQAGHILGSRWTGEELECTKLVLPTVARTKYDLQILIGLIVDGEAMQT